MTPTPEAMAEDWLALLPARAGEELIVRPGSTIWIGGPGTHPELTLVLRLRLSPDEVAREVDQVAALLRARGRIAVNWYVGWSATPPDLVARLLAAGLERYEEEEVVALALRQPLPAMATRVTARRAESIDDYVRAFELSHAVFQERVETDAERRLRAAERLAQHQAGEGALFVAERDGEVVAVGSSRYAASAVVLAGGATHPAHRGLGAYRALVAARHADAIARGTPTLVIQAGRESRPIVERLGFERLGTLQILLHRLC